MSVITALWLPILLSAVAVFIVSSLIHMVFKWHNSDYHGLSNEDAVRDAIRAGNPAPGLYVLPYCKDMKEMGCEAMTKKYQEGPVGFITLTPSAAPNMGKSLGLWFALSLLISWVAAVIAMQSFPGDAHMAAHHVAAVSFVAYGFGSFQEYIWKGDTLSNLFKFLLDAVLYALVTAATFYFLWP